MNSQYEEDIRQQNLRLDQQEQLANIIATNVFVKSLHFVKDPRRPKPGLPEGYDRPAEVVRRAGYDFMAAKVRIEFMQAWSAGTNEEAR